MIRVYLDTNILITGPKYPEHDQLKKMVRDKKIILFRSYHGDIEQHGKVFPLRRKRDLAMNKLYQSEENFLQFKQADSDYEEAARNEQAEKAYWSDVGIFPTRASFDNVVLYHPYGLLPDFKGELALWEQLTTVHKLSPEDAFHAMSAHSSEMDYLLTWDKKSFINKCADIAWLKPKVTTPFEFLSAPTL